MLKRKILYVFLIFLVPALLLAEEVTQTGKQLSFWLLFFSLKNFIILGFSILTVALLLTGKLNVRLRVVVLLSSFVLFGILSSFIPSFFISPSPVCAITKPFWMEFRIQFVASLIFFGILSIIATKGFCGSACPIGALQELIYLLPIFKNIKRKKIPFVLSNIIRIGIACIFLTVVFITGFSIYEYINMFDLIHWEFNLPLISLFSLLVLIFVFIVLSLFFYRPYCYFICPLGLASWVFEQFAPLKVRVKKESCEACMMCVVSSPCPAVKNIINNNVIRADCYLCGICLKKCNKNALYLGV